MRPSPGGLMLRVERAMASIFALFFLLLSVLLGGYTRTGDFGGLLDGLNTAVVALAVL